METDLLTAFADPEKIKELTTTHRLWAGLITTILGMGITFVILIILQFVIGLFEKLPDPEKKPTPALKPPAPGAGKTDEKPVAQTDAELVPVIAASVAMMLETAASNIVIRDIRKVDDTSPSWRRAGIAEQMQHRI